MDRAGALDCPRFRNYSGLTDCFQSFLHNTIGGKYNRGMTVPDTYRILKGVEEPSDEDYKKTAIMGWCTELVSSPSRC